MTSITARPALFAPMAEAFTGVFGNVDVTLVIDGVTAASPVRGILRQVREIDLVTESGVSVEGVTHRLDLSASDAAGLESDRDSVVIGGETYEIRALTDDGRAMINLFLRGDV